MDSSSAVKPGQFRKEKDFIKNLAKYLNVGSADKTKAAVVNYGSFPSTSVKFDDYSTLRDFESGVDRITPAKGYHLFCYHISLQSYFIYYPSAVSVLCRSTAVI